MIIIIIIIIVAQDIEVLNLQGKIDAMTREREQVSKESGQIMDEVCMKIIMTTIIIIMMTIIVKKIESLILHIAFSFPQQTISTLKNPINLILNMKLVDTIVIKVLLLVFCSPRIECELQ